MSQKKCIFAHKKTLMKDKINDISWEGLHPLGLSTLSCRYYGKLAKTLEDDLWIANEGLKIGLPDHFLEHLAVTASGYLEDISSDFGIWSTFRSLCRERYGKTLPFYDSTFRDPDEEYDDESVNYDDVRFIVWMEMNIYGMEVGTVYSPLSDVVTIFANLLYEQIAHAWDAGSPSSDRISELIDKYIVSEDLINVRELAIWLTEGCYLTRVYDFIETIFGQMMDCGGKVDEMLSPDMLFYVSRVTYALTKPLRPLGITSLQFLAALAKHKGFAEAAKRIGETRVVGFAFYNVIGYEGKIATLRCVQRGVHSSPYVNEELPMDVFSLKSRKGLKDGAGIMTSMVKWGDTYCVNGFASISPEAFPEKVEMFENGIPQQTIESLDGLHNYTRETIARNNGSRFVFFKDSEELDNFLHYKADYCSIDLSEGAVLYIGDDGNMEISNEAQVALKSKRNPFYNKKIAPDAGLYVLVEKANLGYEAVKAAIAEGMLTDVSVTAHQGKRVGHKLVQDNISFFADFYHSDFGVDIPADEESKE